MRKFSRFRILALALGLSAAYPTMAAYQLWVKLPVAAGAEGLPPATKQGDAFLTGPNSLVFETTAKGLFAEKTFVVEVAGTEGNIDLQNLSSSNADFQVVESQTTCAGTLSVGSNCEVTVRYTPSDYTLASSALRLSGAFGGEELTIPVTGQGANPLKLYSPTPLSTGFFGNKFSPLEFSYASSAFVDTALAPGYSRADVRYSVVSGLPEGLTLNSETGLFEGAPLARTAAEGATVVVKGELLGNEALNEFTLMVNGELLKDVRAISAGSNTCAVQESGQVYCWGSGSNYWGEFGRPESGTQKYAVKALVDDAVDIQAGNARVCALTKTGAVKCWGLIASATGNTPNNPQAIAALGIGNKQVSLKYAHACALTASNTVKCWGENTSGQLGVGYATPSGSSLPGVHDVVGLPGPVAQVVTSPQEETCVLMVAGTVYCWGANFGTSPVQVTGFAGPIAKLDTPCALLTTGQLQCWSGTAPVAGPHGRFTGTYKDIHMRSGVNCVMGTNSSATCYVAGLQRETTTPNVTAMAASTSVNCFISSKKTVQCQGYKGNLGSGETANVLNSVVNVLLD